MSVQQVLTWLMFLCLAIFAISTAALLQLELGERRRRRHHEAEVAQWRAQQARGRDQTP